MHIFICLYIYIHTYVYTQKKKKKICLLKVKKVLNREVNTALETLMQIKVHIK